MGALNSVLLEILAKWTFSLAPPLITKWLLPKEKLSRRILVKLRQGDSIKFSCQNGICCFESRLEILNKSALAITLDRLTLRVENLSDLNPVSSLRLVEISPTEEGHVYLRKTLSETECRSLKAYFDAGNRLSYPRLEITAVFHTPIGLITKSDYCTYSMDMPSPFNNS